METVGDRKERIAQIDAAVVVAVARLRVAARRSAAKELVDRPNGVGEVGSRRDENSRGDRHTVIDGILVQRRTDGKLELGLAQNRRLGRTDDEKNDEKNDEASSPVMNRKSPHRPFLDLLNNQPPWHRDTRLTRQAASHPAELPLCAPHGLVIMGKSPNRGIDLS